MGRLHDDQVEIDADAVARLVAAQFPRWAGLPVRRVASGGTDNAVFRIGAGLAARMPLRPGGAEGVLKEARWLPVVAPRLTLDVPEVVAVGEPGEGYPLAWTVLRWLPGRDALAAPPASGAQAAAALGGFVRELHGIGPVPAPMSPGFSRGGPIGGRDPRLRAALAECAGLVDAARLTAVWDAALAAPEWSGPPVWLHADLLATNVLVRDGRIAGVLDFGLLCTGDPAYDVTAAWFVLGAAHRRDFLDRVGADEATVARARGLVVSFGVFALPYYLHTNPTMVTLARRALDAVLDD